MARLPSGHFHNLGANHLLEVPFAEPPAGVRVRSPWLLEVAQSNIELHPAVLTYAEAHALVKATMYTFHAAGPRRHLACVRTDEGFFTVAWELTAARMHALGLAQTDAAHVHPATGPQPVPIAAASCTASSQASVMARAKAAMSS